MGIRFSDKKSLYEYFVVKLFYISYNLTVLSREVYLAPSDKELLIRKYILNLLRYLALQPASLYFRISFDRKFFQINEKSAEKKHPFYSVIYKMSFFFCRSVHSMYIN